MNTTSDNMAWNDRDDDSRRENYNNNELEPERLNEARGVRNLDADDEMGVDRNEIAEDNLDDDGDYVNTLSNDRAFAKSYDASEGSEFNEDKDFEAHLAPESVDPDPNEIPEQQEAGKGGSGYTESPEYRQTQEGNDASYSEQTDVTPPKPHEFPLEGPAKGDFVSRNTGRTTGRMTGHEPGTEGF